MREWKIDSEKEIANERMGGESTSPADKVGIRTNVRQREEVTQTQGEAERSRQKREIG